MNDTMQYNDAPKIPQTLAEQIAEWEERLYMERNAERVARTHNETFAKWHEGKADALDRVIDEAKRFVPIARAALGEEGKP